MTVKPPVEGKRSPKWAFMEKMTIPCNDGLVYLVRRRVLQTPWFGILVHDIKSPDTDRDTHDHPWAFLSLVLRGSYNEKVLTTAGDESTVVYKTHLPGSWHYMPLKSSHRILMASPHLKTIIFTGPRTSGWGFYTPDGYVDWKDYENIRVKAAQFRG